MNKRRIVVIIGWLLTGLLMPVHAEESKPYFLGVFPFLSQSQIEPIYSSLTAELSNRLGKPFRYRSSRDMRSFISDIEDEKFEVMFTQPFDYPRVAKAAGYVPLAASSTEFNALFVVRNDSEIKSLQDLKGKTIAALPPIAAVTILGRIELANIGLQEDRDYWFEFTKKHDNCLQLLAIKQVDSCITGDYPLASFRERVFNSLSVIHTSQSIIRPSFFVHNRVLEDERKAIFDVIQKWSLEYEDYQQVRNTIFKAVHDKDFDKVSRILAEIE